MSGISSTTSARQAGTTGRRAPCGQGSRQDGNAARALPAPLRFAVGALDAALARGKRLPSTMVSLPLGVMSRTLTGAMRMRHQVTSLTSRGESVINGFRTPAEQPPWATFDEDAHGGPVESGPVESGPVESGPVESGPVESGRHVASPPQRPVNTAPATAAITAPGGMSDYDTLSLPQVRARMRALDAVQLSELVDYERSHGNRESFLGMLQRRLDKITDSPR